MEDAGPVDKYEQHVDLMNECRAFYHSRVQKTEHYKEVFTMGQSQEQSGSGENRTFVSSMQKLQREIVSLLDQDLALMRQLLTLNEDIEDMKVRTYHGYSKDSFCSSTSSMFYLHARHPAEVENHLATVLSEGDMENMYKKEEESLFTDIENLVIDEPDVQSDIVNLDKSKIEGNSKNGEDNGLMFQQVSSDSGFDDS